jgi:hypothetical protein
MLATVTFRGSVEASEYFDNEFLAIPWLLVQRLARGMEHEYRIETFEGQILHTL